MLHTSVDGSPAHSLYAPCRLADLHGAGFDYWALGHVHQRFEERGRAAIVMPGNPQGRDINEAGPKSATLVTIGDDRKIKIEERSTSVAQFERLHVDLAGVEDWREALERIDEGASRGARRGARASIWWRGSRSPAQRRSPGVCARTPTCWRKNARALGAAIGKTWIDKIELDCVAPRANESAASSDPVAELRALMETEVAQSKAFQDALREIAEELSRNLPHGSRDGSAGPRPGRIRQDAARGCARRRRGRARAPARRR